MKVQYVNWHNQQWNPYYEEIEESEVLEKNRIECYACDWKWTEINYKLETEKCWTCEWRWWNHRDMEWQFECWCWAEKAYADCYENAELNCECFDD